MKTKLFGLLAGIGICALAVQPAAAGPTFFFSTPAGSTCGGQACSAKWEINIDPRVINIGIYNTLNEDQLISAGQALSGFSFTLSDAFSNPGSPPGGGVSGQQANVGPGGTVTFLNGTPV